MVCITYKVEFTATAAATYDCVAPLMAQLILPLVVQIAQILL